MIRLKCLYQKLYQLDSNSVESLKISQKKVAIQRNNNLLNKNIPIRIYFKTLKEAPENEEEVFAEDYDESESSNDSNVILYYLQHLKKQEGGVQNLNIIMPLEIFSRFSPVGKNF